MADHSQAVVDVRDEAGSCEAAEALGPASELAVDVEADAMHAFRARLCFVQVGSDQAIYLFDTLEPGVRPHVLAPLFADGGRTKFFHAAGGDLSYLAEAGIRVNGLFDTHRAATLLGWPKVGLADLARGLLGVELAKEHQQADFAIRPLPPEMRAYIADDVRYLCEIGRQVREACRVADILEEVVLDCQRLCDEAAARPSDAELRVKIPRGQLPPVEHAVAVAFARALHERRLAWAEAADVPMGRMLSNAAVLALATRLPGTLRDLAKAQGVRGAFVREHGEEVLALVGSLRDKAAKGELLPEAAPAGNKDAGRRKREDALRSFRAAKATERKVQPSVVLPNPLVEELAANPPADLETLAKVPYLGEKRQALYGEALIALLNAPR